MLLFFFFFFFLHASEQVIVRGGGVLRCRRAVAFVVLVQSHTLLPVTAHLSVLLFARASKN